VELVQATDLQDAWERLLGELSRQGPSIPALLKDATLVGIEDGQAVLRYPHDQETVVRMLDRNGKKDTIRDVLSGVLNRAVGLRFELSEAPAADEAPKSPE